MQTWEAYLDSTGSEEKITTKSMGRRKPNGSIRPLEVQVHHASLPKSFEEKRKLREINYIKGDIATADIGENKYNLVFCTDVLGHFKYFLGKQLAIYDMANAMQENGLMVVDTGVGRLLFGHFGGYENELPFKLQKAFEIEPVMYRVGNELLSTGAFDERYNGSHHSDSVIFRKTSAN
jgi:hypothetical protein